MIKMPKVLLVEDESALALILKDLLESRNFYVTGVSEGAEAYTRYLSEKPDIIILDIMLPGADGLQIARQIRLEDKHTPILFLTARTMPQHVIDGFEAGGNDYLKKPFDMEELIIRLKVLLNQNRLLEDPGYIPQNSMVEIGEYQYDIMRHLLVHATGTKQLTARESEVLKTLYQYRNRLLSRKNFLLQVWGDDDFFSSRSLDVYISKLRSYFKKDRTIQIINHRGFGYKLIC